MEAIKPATFISSPPTTTTIADTIPFTPIHKVPETMDLDLGTIAKFHVRGHVVDYRPADIRQFVYMHCESCRKRAGGSGGPICEECHGPTMTKISFSLLVKGAAGGYLSVACEGADAQYLFHGLDLTSEGFPT